MVVSQRQTCEANLHRYEETDVDARIVDVFRASDGELVQQGDFSEGEPYMLNTYSVVFTGGRNTCINTRVHSDPPRQPAAATEYSPLLLPPSRVRRPATARPWERAATRGQPCFCCMHEALQALLERGYSGAGAGASAGAGACI